MPIRLLSGLVIATVLLVVPGESRAADNYWSFGFGAGPSRLGGGIDDQRVSDSTRRALVAYRTGAVGLEATRVRLGNFRHSTDGMSGTVDVDGHTAAVVLHMRVDPDITIYGRLGRMRWSAEGDFPDSRLDDSGNDRLAGLGTHLRLTRHWDLMLDYDRYHAGDLEVRATTLTVAYSLR
jgi:hypothetical protein